MEAVVMEDIMARQPREAQAIIRMLLAFYRQSKRRTAEFLSMLLGQPCVYT
jgi:hypothetical protein